MSLVGKGYAYLVSNPSGLPKITRRAGLPAHHQRQEGAERLHEAIEGGGDMAWIWTAEVEARENEQALWKGASRSWKCCWRMPA